MNNNIKEAKRWYQQAEYDWKAAEYSAAGEFFSTACFQSQQSAEKAVKAYLIYQGKRAILSHSILTLLKESAQIDPDFERYYSHGRILDRFYIPTRYPDALPDGMPFESYEKTDADLALEKGKEILLLIKEKIPM